jgi:hypothetical protein
MRSRAAASKWSLRLFSSVRIFSFIFRPVLAALMWYLPALRPLPYRTLGLLNLRAASAVEIP